MTDHAHVRKDGDPETPHARRSEREHGKPDQLREKERDAEDRQEALMDEAIEETFPASDPVSPMRITCIFPSLPSSSGKPRLRGADRGTPRHPPAREAGPGEAPGRANLSRIRASNILREQIAFGTAGFPGLAALAGE